MKSLALPLVERRTQHDRPAVTEVMVTGTGSYVPERILDNARLERLSGKSNEWIVERTGIRERHIAGEGETTSDLALQAALRACANSDVSPKELELIVVATVTGETHFPATACWLQAKLGNARAIPLDVNMGCAGFVYALEIARALMLDKQAATALVVGADRVTGIADYTDARSCILFGDAAGAVILRSQAADGPALGILESCFFSDPTMASLISRPLDAHASPDHPSHSSHGGSFMFMDGPEVYKRAVRGMEQAVRSVVKKAGLALADIDWVVPHQANARIIETVGERLGILPARVFQNIERYGNTSAATIPLCLAEMNEQGLLRHGQRVVLCTFGTGLVWAATLIAWGTR